MAIPDVPEIEKAIIGALLIDFTPRILPKLKSNMFRNDFHRDIYSIISSLYNSNHKVDLLTVTNKLKEKSLLEKIGGAYYLTECIECVTSSANIDEHSDILIEKYNLRQLQLIGNAIINLASNEQKHSSEILESAHKLITNISLNGSTKNIYSMEDVATDWLEYWTDMMKRQQSDYIFTYLRKIDELIKGFNPAEFILLAGRPGYGKTAFAIQFFWENIKRDIPGGFISLESTKRQIIQRIIAGDTGIPVLDLKDYGNYSNINDDIIALKVSEIARTKGYIIDNCGTLIQEVTFIIREMVKKHKVKYIIIDYLQLIRASGENENARTTNISGTLKYLAKELNIPIIALSQLHRLKQEEADRRPVLSDLRSSGSLEQDADVVIFIHRTDYYDREESETDKSVIIIAKRRDGKLGGLEMLFLRKRMRFEQPQVPF